MDLPYVVQNTSLLVVSAENGIAKLCKIRVNTTLVQRQEDGAVVAKIIRKSNSNKSIVYPAVPNHTSEGVRTAKQIHHNEIFHPSNQSELH